MLHTVGVTAALVDLGGLDPHVLLAVAVALIFVQTALVVGFLVPAGKAAVLTGVMAGVGHVSLPLAFVALAASAIGGAAVGYLIGRRHGPAIFEHRRLERHRPRLDRARTLVQERAGFALLTGRSIAVLRATTPALAGTVGVSGRRFALFNVVGGLAWAAVFVGTGYLGGRALPGLENHTTALAVAGAVVVLVLGVLVVRRRQDSAHSSCQPSTSSALRDAGPV